MAAMMRSRGPIAGVVAVLVSSRLGSEYGTVVGGTSADAILDTLPPSVGIYAVMPSCNPGNIVSHMLSLWDMKETSVEPYTVECDGIVMHKVLPDHLLSDIRIFAWDLFAEQHPFDIVEAWGRKTSG